MDISKKRNNIEVLIITIDLAILSQLLRHNPKHRIDLKDAMEHPWIRENSHIPTSSGRSESKSSTSSTSWEALFFKGVCNISVWLSSKGDSAFGHTNCLHQSIIFQEISAAYLVLLTNL